MLRFICWIKAKSVTILALSDDGSQTTLCSSSLLNRLNAVTKPSTINITTITGRTNQIKSSTANLKVSSITGESTIKLNDVKSVPKLPTATDAAVHLNTSQDWKHLSDIITKMKKQCNANGLKDGHPVELRIGINTPEAFWIQEEQRGWPGQPFAHKTHLWWTIQGPYFTKTNCRGAFYSTQDLVKSQPRCLELKKFNDTINCPRTSSTECLKEIASHGSSSRKEFDHQYQDELSSQWHEPYQPRYKIIRRDDFARRKSNANPTHRHFKWKMFPLIEHTAGALKR